MRIDLHTHSTASDGTDSPAGVVHAALAAGLDVVALTDHDTFSGLAAAGVAAAETGVRLVPGVEVSCVAGDVPFHLLAYWCDPDDADLGAELALNRDDRVPRAREITRRLADAGYPITWDGVLAQVPDGATVGRPHLADALVAAGAVVDRDQAFAELLHDGTPYVVGHHYVDHRAIVRLVRSAGGVAVVAHIGASSRGRLIPDEALAEMASDGLAGLEVDHPDHDEATRARLRVLADRLGLLPTGASDYHGTGKKQGIGAETTSPEVLAALEALAGVRALSAVLDPRFFGMAFVTLFVIVDPPGSVPVFLGLTANQNGGQRARSALRAVIVSFAVIVLFAIFGASILRYLSISLPALQGAGGLLLLLVSLELLTGRAETPTSAGGDVDVALVPLGTPLLAGPGAIVATMVAVRQAHGESAKLVALALAILAVHVVIWIVLRFSGAILRVVRDGGISILTRIAGLLLSAIAVQLIADSVAAFVKAY